MGRIWRRKKGRSEEERGKEGGKLEREGEARRREIIEKVKEGEKEVGREGGGKEGSMALSLRPLGFQGKYKCK